MCSFIVDVYAAHNGGATNTTNSTTRSRKPRGQNAILDIVNPLTGKNISDEIYRDSNDTTNGSDITTRDTPQPQVSCIKISYIDN